MGMCHGRMLHSTLSEMLDGSATSGGGADSSAGRVRIGRWAVTYYAECCDMTWDDGGETLRIAATPGCQISRVGDLPSDIWKAYVDVTAKFEKSEKAYRHVTTRLRLFPSVLNDRVLHTVALWLLHVALSMPTEMAKVSGLAPGVLDAMRDRVVEAARARLTSAVVSRMVDSGSDPSLVVRTVDRIAGQDPASFMDRTADVWRQADEITRCSSVCRLAPDPVPDQAGATEGDGQKQAPRKVRLRGAQQGAKVQGQVQTKVQGQVQTKVQGQVQAKGQGRVQGTQGNGHLQEPTATAPDVHSTVQGSQQAPDTKQLQVPDTKPQKLQQQQLTKEQVKPPPTVQIKVPQVKTPTPTTLQHHNAISPSPPPAVLGP